MHMDIESVERSIAEVLDKAKADGRCVDWEIDELVPMGGKELGIKISIYPWGKTIQYGTAGQLLATTSRKTQVCSSRAPS